MRRRDVQLLDQADGLEGKIGEVDQMLDGPFHAVFCWGAGCLPGLQGFAWIIVNSLVGHNQLIATRPNPRLNVDGISFRPLVLKQTCPRHLMQVSTWRDALGQGANAWRLFATAIRC